MIHSTRILKTLLYLDAEYKKNLTASDGKIPILFSKMAVLEYCGWIEEAFDEIARASLRKKLRSYASREILEKQINRTHGFTYDKARGLLAVAVGTIRLRSIEIKLNRSGTLQQLRSNLSALNSMRREAAHTHTSGTTQSFQSPSILISNLQQTEPVLQSIYNLVTV